MDVFQDLVHVKFEIPGPERLLGNATTYVSLFEQNIAGSSHNPFSTGSFT